MSVRHERRRRLLADETSSSDDAAETPIRLASDAAESTTAYATTVRHDCERRVVDLLPSGRASIALLLSAAVVMVALLTAADVWSESLEQLLGGASLTVLRLDTPASCAQWLASTLLAACAPLAWVIYSLRRHRVDDYSGRYRVWLWVGLASLMASLLEGSGMGQVAAAICRYGCQACQLDAAVVWPATLAIVLGGAGLRLLFEVRQCRMALATWLASGASLIASTMIGHGWLDSLLTIPPSAARVAWLVSYVFFLATLLIYTRYVRMQIDGVVASPKRPRKTRTKPEAVDTPSPAKPRPALQLRTDLDPVQPAATAPARAAESKPANRAADREEASTLNVADHGGGQSRAERRRMRRQARMAG